MASKHKAEPNLLFSVFPEIIDSKEVDKKEQKKRRMNDGNKLKKEEKKTEESEKEEEDKPRLPRIYEITMTYDENGVLKGHDSQGGYDVCTLYEGCGDIEDGSLWKCLLHKPVCRFHLHAHPRLGMYPIEIIRGPEKKETVTVHQKTRREITNTIESRENIELRDRIRELESNVRSLQNEKESLRKKYNELNNEKSVLQKEKYDLKQENKRLNKTNDSLSRQVNVLNSKKKGSQDVGMEGIIDRLHQLEVENNELKIFNKELIEDLNKLSMIVYGTEKQPENAKIFLTGPSGLHSILFTGKNYKVRFSPGKGTLLLVEDDEGEIACVDYHVSIPGLERFTQFKRAKSLEYDNTSKGLIVSLG